MHNVDCCSGKGPAEIPSGPTGDFQPPVHVDDGAEKVESLTCEASEFLQLYYNF